MLPFFHVASGRTCERAGERRIGEETSRLCVCNSTGGRRSVLPLSIVREFSLEGVLVGPFQIVLFAVWALSTIFLIALVLMHSGKGTGVSDMIASSLYNASTATGVMEKNLDKLTVIVACVFAACVVLAMFFFPQGIVGL